MGKAATTSSPWQDRIVRMDRVAPDQFVANERNFRVHTGEQTAALTAALEQIGWVAPVIVNETTGRLIDGHLRASLASRAGMAEVPVAYVRLTPEEEAAALLTLDNVTSMAGIDDSAFDALLREVGSLGPDLDAMLAGVAAEVGLYPEAQEAVPPEEFADYDEEIETEYCCPKCGYEWSGKPK